MKGSQADKDKIIKLIQDENLPSVVLNEISRVVLGYDSRGLYFEQERFDALKQVLQQASGLQELVNGFEIVIQHPVVFYHSQIGDYFSSTMSRDLLHHERLVGLEKAIYFSPSKRIGQNQCQRVEKLISGASLDLSEQKSFEYSGDDQEYTVFPLEASKDSLCYVAVQSSKKQLDEWVEKFFLLNRKLILLTFLNLYDLHRMKVREEDFFIKQWLQGQYIHEKDLYFAAQARNQQLPHQDHYHVILVDASSDSLEPGSFIYLDESFNSQYNLSFTHIDGLLFAIEHHSESLKKEFPDFLKKLKVHLTKMNHVDHLYILVSDSGTLLSVPRLYQQVLKAKKVVTAQKIKKDIIECSELRVELVLYSVRDSEETKRFVKLILEPLIKYDQTQQSQLTYTLYAYLTHHSSTKDTAAFLRTHYNTVMYRLEKIEEVLGYPMRMGEGQFKLRLAYELDFLSDKPLCACLENFVK